MNRNFRALVAGLALVAIGADAGAQNAPPVPPVRPLGPVIRVSAPNQLASVSAVRPLPGGRLLVNDVTNRRVVLYDSTLTTFTIVADSSSGSGGMFGLQLAGIIPYKGDSTLFVDPQSMSMLVFDGMGKTARVMAVPRPQDAPYLVGGPFGTPGFDPAGRLIYRGAAKMSPFTMPAVGQSSTMTQPDSSPVVRIDLESRKLDTLGFFKTQKQQAKISRRDDGSMAISTVVNPLPTLDDWAMLPDGTLAIVRGQDFHVDWVAPTGAKSTTAKVPFEWSRLSDEDRATVGDSVKAAMEKQFTDMRAKIISAPAAAPLAGAASARAGSEGGPVQRGAAAAPVAQGLQMPTILMVPANELPDYRPAFAPGAARADADGNLWIRTSQIVNKGAVYYVVNRKGELIDRIAVPQFRMIAGFGAGGVVYMGVLDGTAARLEEARVR